MKAKILLLLTVISFVIISICVACNQGSQKTNNEQVQNGISKNPNLKLQIYYFHSTYRCPTCLSIEANVKKVLEDNYKDEIEKGIIKYSILNFEDPKNRSLAEKYQVTGSALHLVHIENGKGKDYDLTEYAFSYSRTQPGVFLKGIDDTIRHFIR